MSDERRMRYRKDGVWENLAQEGVTVFPDSTTRRHVSVFQNGEWKRVTWDDAPEGTITMTTSDTIPEGWQVCDGTNDTPDLRNRFIKGADEKGSSDGNATHTHDLSSEDEHSHSQDSNPADHTHGSGMSSSADHAFQSDDPGIYTDTSRYDNLDHTHDSTDANSHDHNGLEDSSLEPEYYKLLFIQKVG